MVLYIQGIPYLKTHPDKKINAEVPFMTYYHLSHSRTSCWKCHRVIHLNMHTHKESTKHETWPNTWRWKKINSCHLTNVWRLFIYKNSVYWRMHAYTGCPAKLFPLGYLLFCRLLLMQIAKVMTFLKNTGNLLHDRHKNFENRFRNNWDNWGQSCHL